MDHKARVKIVNLHLNENYKSTLFYIVSYNWELYVLKYATEIPKLENVHSHHGNKYKAVYCFSEGYDFLRRIV